MYSSGVEATGVHSQTIQSKWFTPERSVSYERELLLLQVMQSFCKTQAVTERESGKV